MLRKATILEHADDGDPGLADLEGPADRILGREEARAYAMADDRDREPALHLQRGECRAGGKRQIREAEIRGVHAHQLSRAAQALPSERRIEDDFRARHLHARNHPGDRLGVRVGEAGRELRHLLLGLVIGGALVLLHERRDHHVVRAEQAHLLEDFPLGALPDREHRNDGGDAEQDAQRGEGSAQLVVLHGFDRRAHAESDVRDELAAQLGDVHRTGGGAAMSPRGAVSPPATGRLSRAEAGRRVSAIRS